MATPRLFKKNIGAIEYVPIEVPKNNRLPSLGITKTLCGAQWNRPLNLGKNSMKKFSNEPLMMNQLHRNSKKTTAIHQSNKLKSPRKLCKYPFWTWKEIDEEVFQEAYDDESIIEKLEKNNSNTPEKQTQTPQKTRNPWAKNNNKIKEWGEKRWRTSLEEVKGTWRPPFKDNDACIVNISLVLVTL